MFISARAAAQVRGPVFTHHLRPPTQCLLLAVTGQIAATSNWCLLTVISTKDSYSQGFRRIAVSRSEAMATGSSG